jgi:hypothetical protein
MCLWFDTEHLAFATKIPIKRLKALMKNAKLKILKPKHYQK